MLSPETATLDAPAQEAAVRALGLCQHIGKAPLLRDLSFTLPRGELIAVLGPSGAGKSLLIELLSGATRPSAGYLEVLGSGPRERGARIGYVPQTEIVHEALTVREALVTTAQLRAPHLAASPLLLETRIARIVTRLGLAPRLEVRIGRLSGGERRRVSLATELLTEPDLLICDEVTSGLDAASEERVMRVLGELAAAGTTVVCTTHTLQSADVFDRVLVLHGGRLIFSGDPAAALSWFEISRLEDLYRRLSEGSPEEWEARGRARRQAAPKLPLGAPRLEERSSLPGPPGLHQLWPLMLRQVRVTLRDGRSLLLLLTQALVIALLIGFAYDVGTHVGRVEVGFKLVLSAIWLGCVTACQELVKERTIYCRDRLAGLSPHAYLLAKISVLAVWVSTQTAVLTAVIYACEPLSEPIQRVGGVLVAAALSGAALGLLISSCVSTRTAAVGLTPLVLVPQILLVGTLEPLRGVAASLGKLMPSHWANEAMRHVLLEGSSFPRAEVALLALFSLGMGAATWTLLLSRDGMRRSVR